MSDNSELQYHPSRLREGMLNAFLISGLSGLAIAEYLHNETGLIIAGGSFALGTVAIFVIPSSNYRIKTGSQELEEVDRRAEI